MPKQKLLVRCPDCRKTVEDPLATRATCPECGTSPIPSRAYPRDSSFYPKPLGPTLQELHDMVAQRRGR